MNNFIKNKANFFRKLLRPRDKSQPDIPPKTKLGERSLDFEERRKVKLPIDVCILAVAETLNRYLTEHDTQCLEPEEISNTYKASITALVESNTAQIDTLQVDLFGIAGMVERPTAFIFEGHNRDVRSWKTAFIIKTSEDPQKYEIEPIDLEQLAR